MSGAASDLGDLDTVRDRKVMQRFLNEIKKEAGLAVYGEEAVRKALEAGAVEIILISDGLKKYRINAICKNCNYTLDQIVDKLNEQCPRCKNQLEIREKKDILEEFTSLANDSSAEIEIIGRENEEGEILYKAFGGLAGILRYKL